MPGRTLRGLTWLLASLLLGCAPAPAPSPAVTAPPIPADFVPWPDLLWTTVELSPPPAGVDGERIGAVTASDRGFVGVGYRQTGDTRDGVAWWSRDGSRWSVATEAAFASIELVDVAPAPNGFVALGVASPDGDQPAAVVFGSSDGKTWQRLPPLQATGETYPSGVAGGPDGVVVVGSDVAGAVAAWRSSDGRSFQRVALAAPAGDGIVDPHEVDGGFVALGTKDGAPALLRSKDGSTWDATLIDARTEAEASALVTGRWGFVVEGSVNPSCEDADACVPTNVAWWSLDGERWGLLPGGDAPTVNGVSLLVPAGDHGLLAIDSASAWSSPDGWAWRPLPEPGDGSFDLDDAVVRGDVIVGVGQQQSEVDDTSVGRIVVGRPPTVGAS